MHCHRIGSKLFQELAFRRVHIKPVFGRQIADTVIYGDDAFFVGRNYRLVEQLGESIRVEIGLDRSVSLLGRLRRLKSRCRDIGLVTIVQPHGGHIAHRDLDGFLLITEKRTLTAADR